MTNIENQPAVALLMTGSELMSGDTIDSNSAFIAQALLETGLEVREKVTVGDDRTLLSHYVKSLSSNHDVLIVNGGLGPTQDDLTAEVLANAAGCELKVNAEAEQHIRRWCEGRGIRANDSTLKQALLPAASAIYPEAPGSAPAFFLMVGECLVIATPGVPSEMRTIVRRDILPALQERFPLSVGSPWERYQLFGLGESRLQQFLNEDLAGIDEFLEIGFRAGLPTVELKFKALPGKDEQAIAPWREKLLTLFRQHRLGSGGATVAAGLIDTLKQAGASFSCAESCTGGLIASEMTRVPGSSEVFPGAVVSYSNEMKHKLLGVSTQTLEQFGAVSRETAQEMLQGVLKVTGSDYGVAVTGIAGPDGGSEEKPVGTVWLAWGSAEQCDCICLKLTGGRRFIQTMTMAVALDLVRRQVGSFNRSPSYLKRWQAQ